MLAHVGLEVADLARSAAFYDAVLGRLGIRRIVDGPAAIGYGRVDPQLWIVARGRGPAPTYGHVAIEAAGRPAVDAAYEAGLAHGGNDDGPPGDRPQYGPRCYAAYLHDPDGLRLELVSNP